MANIKSRYSCMLTLAMDLVGGKWKMLILWQLKDKPARFNELNRLLSGITNKMLTQDLRELENSGLISRTVYPIVPPKVEYALTDEGQKLIPILQILCNWSTNYAKSHKIAELTCSSNRTKQKSDCS